MSTIVVFGATGYAGSAITAEARARGMRVVAVARNISNLQAADDLAVAEGSIFDADFVKETVAGADAVVVALHAIGSDGERLLDALPSLLDAAASAGARLSFVGGAGSLVVADGGPRLFDTPEFPEAFAAEARAHAEILDALRNSDTPVDWFYVSPAAAFGSYNPGERTGAFRVGGDVLLTDADGNSMISGADFAIAYVDELEHPAHHRERFGVAY
ncbi:NAD(P)-dependent oxidoreductase [Curtobacterium ammoniigenes]|uniref:NAD(P)-dependent oxidoreductase n=1 Tax=Curtobacterium ammoniigenes TaxID=395387 RepID=UPI0008339872|nr:NAD(P)H-binding protein [Curtobacterium ammoniigenes]